MYLQKLDMKKLLSIIRNTHSQLSAGELGAPNKSRRLINETFAPSPSFSDVKRIHNSALFSPIGKQIFIPTDYVRKNQNQNP